MDTASRAELELVEELEGERRQLRCTSCANEWLRGEAKRIYEKATTIDDLRKRFPSPDDLLPEARERTSALKDRFLARHPMPRRGPTAFQKRYRQLFSRDGLPMRRRTTVRRTDPRSCRAWPG